MTDQSTEDTAPGWDAIDTELKHIYGNLEHLHQAPVPHYRFGGNNPLDGISTYRNPGPPPHWHFVSYGMSELYAKEFDDPELSGWGFEFTFRLAASPDEERPANWPLNFLNNLARYVFKTGKVFDAGHHIDLRGPIALDSPTLIRAALFAPDPQLRPISTPNGKLKFLQVVGVTLDEYEAARAWDSEKFLMLLETKVPLLVTDLDRASTLEDPDTARLIAEQTARDGSSTAALFIETLSWEVLIDGRLRITIGASAVPNFVMLLRGRTLHARGFMVAGPKARVIIEAGDSCTHKPEDATSHVTLPPPAALRLADTIQPRQGDYPVPGIPSLLISVVPSRIKDGAGNVVQVIGE